MRKCRFIEAQIVSILKDWDAGAAVAEVARKHRVHANMLRLWRSKCGGLEVSDLGKLKQLEEKTTRMRRIIATQALEIDAMKEHEVDLHFIDPGKPAQNAWIESSTPECATSSSTSVSSEALPRCTKMLKNA